ncbi:type VII secretion target [Mycobacterium dioxanotrophicus]|uniref:type VII secretion target n=1 Tax=Mycobacterium dioxanotrophicus TaxID=482462 RepID=UPI0012F96749|nr:type VII secretion target [Mycobacterium dioxanotrophicus]
MNVDPSLLVVRAAKFSDAATDQITAGSVDRSQTESDIAAFGEINAILHEQFRTVKALQAQSWAGLGKDHELHAEKLSAAARGYGNTDDANGQALRTVPEGSDTQPSGS